MGAWLRRTRCLMCTSNKHSECDLHMNDGAVDAEDFVHVSCDCPCNGEVEPGGKLIDLVAVLRDEIADLEEKSSAGAAESEQTARAHRALLAQIGNYLDEIFDDEGDGLSVSPYRTWLKTLRALQDRYVRTLAEFPLTVSGEPPQDEDEDPLAWHEEDDLSPGVTSG